MLTMNPCITYIHTNYLSCFIHALHNNPYIHMRYSLSYHIHCPITIYHIFPHVLAYPYKSYTIHPCAVYIHITFFIHIHSCTIFPILIIRIPYHSYSHILITYSIYLSSLYISCIYSINVLLFIYITIIHI